MGTIDVGGTMSRFQDSMADERSIVSLESISHDDGSQHGAGAAATRFGGLLSPSTPTHLHVFMDSFRSETRYPIVHRCRTLPEGELGDDPFVLHPCSPVTYNDSPSSTTLAQAMILHNQGLLRQRAGCHPTPALPVPIEFGFESSLPCPSALGDTPFHLPGGGKFDTLHDTLTSLAHLQPGTPPPSRRTHNPATDDVQGPAMPQNLHAATTNMFTLPASSRRASAPTIRKASNSAIKRHGSSSAWSDVSSITWEDSSVHTDGSLGYLQHKSLNTDCRTPLHGKRLVRQQTKLECDLDSALLYSFSDSPPKSPQRRGSLRSSPSECSTISPSSAGATIETKRQCRHPRDSSWGEQLSEPPPLWIVSPVRHQGLRRSVQ